MKINKKILIIVLILMLIIIAGCSSNNATSNVVKSLDGNKIIVYKSQSCGCCTGYVSFLKSKGFLVEVIDIQDMSVVKDKYNIPVSMRSCHTAIVDDYFIEGHMPIEAINKLLEEKPNIDGIALPGMPSGSPGMPGRKTEEWNIYSIKDGSYSEFITI